MFRCLGDFALKLPWPLWNREIYIEVTPMAVQGENSIIVNMKSLPTDTWLNGYKVDKDSQTTEAEVIFCAVYLEYLEPNKTRLRYIGHTDPKFETIPDWLINFVIKCVAFVFLDQIGKRALNLSNIDLYSKLRVENKEFYEMVDKRIARNKLELENPMIIEDIFNPEEDELWSKLVI